MIDIQSISIKSFTDLYRLTTPGFIKGIKFYNNVTPYSQHAARDLKGQIETHRTRVLAYCIKPTCKLTSCILYLYTKLSQNMTFGQFASPFYTFHFLVEFVKELHCHKSSCFNPTICFQSVVKRCNDSAYDSDSDSVASEN